MGKYLTHEEYRDIEDQLKGKTVVMCHGVFDLLHPGHITHFKQAKAMGDILVVSVTAKAFVRKGPDRPYFDDQQRIDFLSAIECVDYVLLSNGYTVEDTMSLVKPNFYVKGEEYKDASQDVTGKIDEEVALVRKYGGDVRFTTGETYSSTKLINNHFASITPETKEFVKFLKTKYDIADIKRYAEKFQDLKVLVVGDIIIDEYVFCEVQGIMSKDIGYSTRCNYAEQYLGGSLAIARHIHEFCKNVTLTSVIGSDSKMKNIIEERMDRGINLDLFQSNEFETIVKTRYVQQNKKREELQKLFAVNNLNRDLSIDEETMIRFRENLNEIVGDFDLVMVCDFGHGLIDAKTQKILEDKARFLAVNCQTNSSNYGSNLISKYKKLNFYSLDQKEIKLAFNRNEEEAMKEISEYFGVDGCLTVGSSGSIMIGKDGKQIRCPAFTLQVRDTIGAGDAFYSMASLCKAVDMPNELILFVANTAGALATNITGNKNAIDKSNVLKFASTLLNI